ncbi:MAG TPA: hypothetical protein VLZ07_03540 [Syntrophales bacterium]|nr:hypothetical protein [Syntrophales bacterium]
MGSLAYMHAAAAQRKIAVRMTDLKPQLMARSIVTELPRTEKKPLTLHAQSRNVSFPASTLASMRSAVAKKTATRPITKPAQNTCFGVMVPFLQSGSLCPE